MFKSIFAPKRLGLLPIGGLVALLVYSGDVEKPLVAKAVGGVLAPASKPQVQLLHVF